MSKRKVLPVRELFKFSPEELKNNLHTDLDILFENNEIIHAKFREIILFRFMMEVYKSVPELKIHSKHFISNFYVNGYLTSKSINGSFEKIIEDIVEYCCKPSGSRAILDYVYEAMQDVYNDIYNKLTYQTQEYCNSIHINDLLDIQMMPELLDAIKQVADKKDVISVNNTYSVLDKTIRQNKKLQNNTIAKGYISGSINANQIKQILASRGYITEINSTIFKTPVAASFTLGMSNIYDLAIESRSGAKALEMSHKAIQNSEYFARELQLITMIVEKLVDGDCGSRKYLEWYVRPKTDTTKPDLHNLLGKYFLNEETGQEEVITAKHTYLEGKTIKLRTGLNCELSDKNAICSKCFGDLAYSIPRHFNIGHYCTTVVTQKLTQSLLSTKHLTSSALSNALTIDPVAKNILIIKNNNYYFKPNILNSNMSWELIVSQNEAFGLKDLKHNYDVYKLNPTRVSLISNIILKSTNNKNGKQNVYPIIIKDGTKYGSFTYEFISYITTQPPTLDEYDNYVISLDGYNSKSPLITMPEIEYSFEALVKSIKSKFRDIEMTKNKEFSIETPESFLQILFDLVNSKLDVNLALLEVTVYAFTVASVSRRDYGLSRGSKDRTLLKSTEVSTIRSLGTAYGWEDILDKVLLSPKCYYGYNAFNHPMDLVIKPHNVLMLGDK